MRDNRTVKAFMIATKHGWLVVVSIIFCVCAFLSALGFFRRQTNDDLHYVNNLSERDIVLDLNGVPKCLKLIPGVSFMNTDMYMSFPRLHDCLLGQDEGDIGSVETFIGHNPPYLHTG